MAEERKITTRERREVAASDDLPSLIERLTGDVAKLFDQKVSLLKVEIKEDINVYLRGVIAMIAGGILAAVGLALANIALAFAFSTLFANTNLTQAGKYATGFVLTGILYLVIGVVIIMISKTRLAQQQIVPVRSVQELQKDKEWMARL